MAIQAVNLTKSFGNYRIFENLSFEISSGQCFALFGSNGAGKTTLLRILATLVRPTSGEFSIFGKDGIQEKDAVRQTIMFLAHGSHLYDDLDALENLRFALAMRNQQPSSQDMKRALDRVSLGAFAGMKTRNFSAGMKRRLALAKVILAQPQVLFLDEPYNALDEAGVQTTNTIILEVMTRNGLVVMTTHDQEKAHKVSTRSGLLRQGSLTLS
ncbi:MAG: heme ABC exporter ATP-binding protein CcmA [Nitrospirales bacterium]|nr:heme ABC exporter ATP-binding protein CcmA [Nitrospira sp.]MDR4501715.1 heme ABC exporter ATP-binding protein CcmA [Nitrospirales bacterium]